MYQLSRSLYRELAPMLPHPDGAAAQAERQYILDTCETALPRLVLEPELCVTLTRSLFRDLRHLFPVDVQADVRQAVHTHVEVGRILAARLQDTFKRECQAVTRRGTPCRREPPPGGRFCPSHYALEEALGEGTIGERELLGAAA